MKRRELITLLGSTAAAWPLAARAQQPNRMRRIGVLMGFLESNSQAQSYIAAFRDGLQMLGWTESHNVRIDTRWAAFDAETTPTTAALLEQTRTIPIILATVTDPIGSGFVADLPQPCGNVERYRLPQDQIGLMNLCDRRTRADGLNARVE
jgi:putative ABC transport system substrate-binding protein